MKRRINILGLCLLLSLVLSSGVSGKPLARNPLDWLNELEKDVLGAVTEGNLFDRLTQFEMVLTGRAADNSLVDRLFYLESLLYSNQPHDICLLYKLQALEWVLYREMTSGALLSRLEKIELFLYGQTFSGPITKRLERLISQIFPNGDIEANWVSIPEGLLVKAKMADELSSVTSKAGDEFKFVIAETLAVDGNILFPKGSVGVGVVQSVKRPGNLGRDARLSLGSFKIRAIDGSFVNIGIRSDAYEFNRSYQWAVAASALGMAAFGPEGILLGLAVKGKEWAMPVGTEFYLQITEPIRIYTLRDNRR